MNDKRTLVNLYKDITSSLSKVNDQVIFLLSNLEYYFF